MGRHHIFSGSPWEDKVGYARALVLEDAGGDWVMVSGTTGFDYATMTISDDVGAQTEQALKNISAALGEAGCTLDDVVRVTYVLTDASYFEAMGEVTGRYFATAKPAVMAIIAGLVDPAMKVEIEVTARKAA